MLGAEAIEKMPTHYETLATDGATTLGAFAKRLRRSGYIVTQDGDRLTAHWGRIGRTAATITHIGLLSLLVGVTITSWTGFAGFEPVLLHESLNFAEAKHSNMWVGKMPTWHTRVDATRREDYPSGDPKQWYTTLTVIDNKSGKELKKQEISVNNPLSYDGVDIYQSSWGLHGIVLSFNGKPQMMRLNDMGRVHAAMLPLDKNTIMIFSIRDPKQPVRVFAKIPEWQAPRFLTLLPPGKPVRMGSIEVEYKEIIPATGLQYKKDPGLPITYLAFGFIITGVLMASIPFRQLWAALQRTEDGETKLVFGGTSRKAKNAFARSLERMKEKMDEELVACRNSK
jgi:cytochrome c biogenesis protein